MKIDKVYIENFKSFKGGFAVEFTEGVNILVGNNEVGKSTILEAIHLALTGIISGRYLRNELSQYLFNNDIVKEYLTNIRNGKKSDLPHILIEVFFKGNDLALFEGDANSTKAKASGVRLKIEFNEDYKSAYEALVKKDFDTIPIEFYKIIWSSFARSAVISRIIPIKSILIDSSSHRYHNGSDIYISRIIKNHLSESQRADISQTFRMLKDEFKKDSSIKAINEYVRSNSITSATRNIEISVDLSTKDAWESTLMTYLDEVPFHQIGKGEQCIVKTNLSLSHQKSENANLILLEEPENHLSHTKLNEFVNNIKNYCQDKQIIISTHSSFVANKLGLSNLIMLNVHNNKKNSFRLDALEDSTYDYFKKLPGYDTLRLVLCKKAILVEGDSDELIIQKAYMDSHDGRLPIEDSIDVISVKSLAFKRFLEIAMNLNKLTAVVTDNDGDFKNRIEKKYEAYKDVECISIFSDRDDSLNTLEPQLVRANKKDLSNLCKALKLEFEEYNSEEKIVDYMSKNKTECALNVFESNENIVYPEYINKVILWCDEK